MRAARRSADEWYAGAHLVGVDEQPDEMVDVMGMDDASGEIVLQKRIAGNVMCRGPFASSDPERMTYPRDGSNTKLCGPLYNYMLKAMTRNSYEYRAEHVKGAKRTIVGTAACLRSITMFTIRQHGLDLYPESLAMEGVLDRVAQEVAPLLSYKETRDDGTRVEGLSYVTIMCGSEGWPGVGEQLFRYMREHERAHSAYMFLWSVRDKTGFYEKQGMHVLLDSDSLPLVPMLYRYDPRIRARDRSAKRKAPARDDFAITQHGDEDAARALGVPFQTVANWRGDQGLARAAGWRLVPHDDDTLTITRIRE